MILADTSIWVDHFRRSNPELVTALHQAQVLVHRFVLGELALGGLAVSTPAWEALQGMPMATQASDEEVLASIHSLQLAGQGIGYVDAHLLAAARLTPRCRLWTLDRRLQKAAVKAGVGYTSLTH